MALREHKGLGDTVEALLKFTYLYKLAPDKCGCEKRKKRLNKLWTYKTKNK